jgi:hypothetical protein
MEPTLSNGSVARLPRPSAPRCAPRSVPPPLAALASSRAAAHPIAHPIAKIPALSCTTSSTPDFVPRIRAQSHDRASRRARKRRAHSNALSTPPACATPPPKRHRDSQPFSRPYSVKRNQVIFLTRAHFARTARALAFPPNLHRSKSSLGLASRRAFTGQKSRLPLAEPKPIGDESSSPPWPSFGDKLE